MRLGDLGEFELIARIERAARRAGSPRFVVLGIGDDAAILRLRSGEDLVVTTDSLVEDVHFRWRSQSARTIGRRALVANLSDLAAMGARPLGFTLALVTPASLEVATLDGLVAGLLREARRHGCPLVGGNVSRGTECSLTITALGAVRRGRALTRRGVRRGDRLFVTGTVGGPALELARAERGLGQIRRVPQPRLEAGRALTRVKQIGGCIDISDGLDADLDHLLETTRLAAEVAAERIPLPRGFRAACRKLGLEPERLARTGGEDYELLFSVRPAGPGAGALARRLGVAVTEIGRLRAAAAVQESRPGPAPHGGFRHF